jgi:hypothetical protein
MPEPIPGPPGLPILGNINDVDPVDTTASLSRLADTYGMFTMLEAYLQNKELTIHHCRPYIQAQSWWQRQAVHLDPRFDGRGLRREAIHKNGIRSFGADSKWY